MFLNARLSTANYDALLIGWSAQTHLNSVTFSGGSSQYCLGETARSALTGAPGNWIITDGGKNCGVVWDGGGADSNWSTAANWVGDSLPTSASTVYFDSTSAKNAVIDSGFGAAVSSVLISKQYAGNLTFGRALAVSGGYIQAGGTVTVDPAYAFTVNGAFTHSGGTLRQVRPVNGASVAFLQITDSGGSLVKYRGLNLDTTTSGANLGSTTVSIRAVDPASGEFCTTDGIGSPAYVKRCYTITPTTDGAAKVRLWVLNSQLNGILASNLAVYRNTPPNTWTELTTNRLTGSDGGIYSYAEGDTPGFSRFLLGQTGNAPTAIALQSFSSNSSRPLAAAVLAGLVALVSAAGLRLRCRRRQA